VSIPKEGRGTEDSLESNHQAPVVRAALPHSERVQHLRGTAESNDPAMLTKRPN
jgi:hypothetical protein